MRFPFARLAVLAAAAFIVPLPLAGQRRHSPDDWVRKCREWDSERDERHCEVREVTMRAGALRIDAHPNGGIDVLGSDRSDIRVVARIQTQARYLEDAEALAKEIRIEAADGEVRAVGPVATGRRSWSVGFDVYVPRRTDLHLGTRNGGLHVEGVTGRLDLRTTNGGLHLTAVGGDVDAETMNGGIHVELTGRRWEGNGLVARTSNGGVDLLVPEDYSAELEAGTVNGGLEVDFPVTVQGKIGRRITTTLGDGGPPVRVSTQNGGVRVRRMD
jgi:Putative adhesin